MKVKLLTELARVPRRGSEGAAGFDLSAIEDCIVPPGTRECLPTGIAVEFPEGVYGRIAPRSGLAVRGGIDVLAGVIDRDYRGQIVVCVINHGYDEWRVCAGDRIAQIIPEMYDTCEVAEVVEELSGTERGTGGFGSTG